MVVCEGCGAKYLPGSDSCAARFEVLLGLDHSRTEPWGSRHGLAFSAYVLQHPHRFDRSVLERAWLLLFSVYVNGADRIRLAEALRRLGKANPQWQTPPVPAGQPPPRFDVTIKDLGGFEAATYAGQLDQWCESALASWRALTSNHTKPLEL